MSAPRKFDRDRIEAAASAIGKILGPQEVGCGRWTDEYMPKVKWPDDYSDLVQCRIREAAKAALDAASKV